MSLTFGGSSARAVGLDLKQREEAKKERQDLVSLGLYEEPGVIYKCDCTPGGAKSTLGCPRIPAHIHAHMHNCRHCTHTHTHPAPQTVSSKN